jgi:SNF family Na+-dependent transporter
VALSQPVIAFFEDEFGWLRKKSVRVLGVIFVVSVLIPMFVRGGLDEMDFWVATFALVLLALCEIIIFFWIFGAENAWAEITRGAHISIPRIFFYITKYVTPVFLMVSNPGCLGLAGTPEGPR